MSDLIFEAINKALGDQIRKEAEKLIEKSKIDLEKAIREQVAKVCMTVSNYYDYQNIGDRIIITVRIGEPK